MNKLADFYDLDAKRRKRFQKGYCLHPRAPTACSPNFISAHTVQRAMLEKHLAENKHVLKFTVEGNPKLDAVLFSPELFGHRVATTFHGFCGFHDNSLFKPLDTKKFTFEPEQIALLGFRSFSRELFNKEAALDVNIYLRDHMLGREELQTTDRLEFLFYRHLSLQNAVSNVKHSWSRFGEMVALGDFSDLRYLAIEFREPPAYFVSTAFLPEWDFEGAQIQDLGEIEEFRGISFSAWAAEDRAAAVFCWHKEWSSICLPFVESLRKIDESRMADRILSLAFEVSDNVVMKPSWWAGLGQHERELLTKRVPSGGTSVERQANCLCEDGLKALSSQVSRVIAHL